MKRSDLEQLQRAANGVCRAIFRASNGEVRVTALMDKDDSFFIECAPHSWRGGCDYLTVIEVALAVKHIAKIMNILYELIPAAPFPDRNVVLKMKIEKDTVNENEKES